MSHILIVGNQANFLEHAAKRLESEGDTVHTALSAEEALIRIIVQHPDLILMGRSLRGMGGFSLAMHLKSDPATRDIRIVTWTPFGSQRVREMAAAACCDGHMVKSMDGNALAAGVARFLCDARPTVPTKPRQPKGLNVLIVDDTVSSREVLVDLLQSEGHAIFEAADGLQAFACLEGQKIDAVISDVMMPLMNGYQLCHKIRGDKRFKDVPVIIYSGTLISPTSEKLASELGAVRFLRKPASLDIILATLREVLTEVSSRRNQPAPIEASLSLPSENDGRLLDHLETQNRHFRDVTERLLLAHHEILTLSVALKQSEESLIEKNAQLEEDLNMARETQLALLPRIYPCFPKGTLYEERAFRFHQRFAPKGAVSGDLFDVPALSDTKAGIFICDVMGHGVRAALVTAVIRGILSELARVLSDPGEVLAEINRKLVPILGQAGAPMFASAFYMTADAVTGEIHYANAGHPSPFLIRRETGLIERLGVVGREHGPALGFIEELQYPTGKRVLAPHDLVLLFTDGIFDAAGADAEPFGEERLLDIVRGRIGMPPEQLFDELLAEVHRFSSTVDFEDDVCLVGMEVDHLCP